MSGISVYEGVLVVHVLTAMMLVGATLLWPSVSGALRNAQSVSEVRGILNYVLRASKSKPIVALVLLGSGVYLGSAGWWAQPWFYVAVAAWLANSVIAATVLERSAHALGTAVARAPEGPVGPDVDRLRRSGSWELGMRAMMANDISMVVVMFAKPELAGSLAAVLGGNAMALAISAARHRTGRSASRIAVGPTHTASA